MKRVILIFSAALFCISAETPEPLDNGTVSSTDASYDGNALHLTGHVVLDHGLGKMQAEEASLARQEAGKDFPFSLIQLRKDVVLALKNSAQIVCDSADLDFVTLKGSLYPAENAQVVYTDVIKKKKGAETSPFKLSGQNVELHFSKQSFNDKKSDYEIDNILAKENVVIDYADNFQLHAHEAFYRKELSRDNKTSKKEFQGVVTAYPKDALSPCKLIHEGDEIFADMVDIDLINSKLSLLRPKGILAAASLSSLQKGQTHFHADYLYWDQVKNTLTLKGGIFIEESVMGTLQASDEMQITQTQIEGKTALKTIQTHGHTDLRYKDLHNNAHQLISHGNMHLDREKLRAVMDSPVKNGVVGLDEQLYYQEEEMAIYADHAVLEYSLVGEVMQPSLLTLKGNIRLFSHDSQKPPRFGLADRLTYSTTTRTLILSADPGKKVLFWDEVQGMRLAAPEVHITHDSETHQQNVKGIGAVQFSFTTEEHNKLLHFFPQLKSL